MLLLEGDFAEGDRIVVDRDEEGLVFSKAVVH
jgi:hypothetical protein